MTRINDDKWECNFCGVVIANVDKHLEYSHPKKRLYCPECNGSGSTGTKSYDYGLTFVLTKCIKCDGAGVYESEERQ